MKYYSEILNKNFDTVKELEEAEGKEKFKLATKAKAEERKKTLIEKAKADYEEAVKKYNAAVNEYDRAREAYIKARNNYYKLVGDVPGRCSSGMIDEIWKKLFEEYF